MPVCIVVTCAVVVEGNCERSGETVSRRSSGWSRVPLDEAHPERVEQDDRDAIRRSGAPASARPPGAPVSSRSTVGGSEAKPQKPNG